MSRPSVTVVIPTFNAERHLGQAMGSVFSQTLQSFEVIVVDDASTDRTVDIVRGYGERVRLICRPENSHTADIPRYEGVEAARGGLCAFLDADDLWEPGKLARQVEFMQRHPEVPLCHSYVRVIDDEGRPLHVRHEGAIPPTGLCARELLHHCFISTSSVMVRRDAWLAAQRREDLTSYGTEWDFFLSIAREHPIGFIPEVLASYRHTPGGVSSRRWKRTPRDVGAKKRIYRKDLWQGVVPGSVMKDIIVEACEEGADYWCPRSPARSLYFCFQGLSIRPCSSNLWRRLVKGLGRTMFSCPSTPMPQCPNPPIN